MSKPKRFIIERQSALTGKWGRSVNPGIDKGTAFATREEAQAALQQYGGFISTYRIRQK